MRIHVIDTGFFKLDGGAMFGVVPKVLWSKHNPADENNLCSWAMRCLLIEDEGRRILIDTGLGDKQDAKFFGYYYLHGDASLIKSISNAGFSPEDITDVILTHLHFDHVGGAVRYDENRENLLLTFPHATYWASEGQWELAKAPNAREKDSFLKENFIPIEESGQLRFIKRGTSPFSQIEFLFADGHTSQMLVPIISYKGKKLVYAADLIPSSAHIPLAWVMSYDVRPLQAIDEKARLLEEAVDQDYILLFEHDPVNEAGTVERTAKGIRIKSKGALADFIN
jgi:glyoxylase-like metal-dependent hydrolase (beta-lactamase superfamily II)